MNGEQEHWAKLSEAERERRFIESNYTLLRTYSGNATITFSDEITPALYPEDPHRHCYYVGELQEVGEDADGPWALVALTAHKIQMTSEESLSPGFNTLFSAMYGEPESLLDGVGEIGKMRQENPETGMYLDLPYNNQPTKFYVKDMEGLMVTTHATKTDD